MAVTKTFACNRQRSTRTLWDGSPRNFVLDNDRDMLCPNGFRKRNWLRPWMMSNDDQIVECWCIPNVAWQSVYSDNSTIAMGSPNELTLRYLVDLSTEFEARYWTSDSSIQNVRRKHEIENQMTELQSRDKNRDRDILINQLKSELKSLT